MAEWDWRKANRQLAVDTLEARDMEKWTALLVGLTAFARPADIEEWAYEMLRSVSHAAQVWWLGACNCHSLFN